MKQVADIIRDNVKPAQYKERTVKFNNPDEFVAVTLDTMAKFARKDAKEPMIQELAKQAKSCCNCCTAIKMMKIVTDNVQYKADPQDKEYVRRPIHTLAEGAGDCDDMSALFAALCIASNIPVAYKAIAWRRHEYTHVFCMFYAKKYDGWIAADPVIGIVGRQKKPIIRQMIKHV